MLYRRVKCHADEAHMGGIVIRLAYPTRSERLEGAIMGLLIGDALGVPYEFTPKHMVPAAERIEFSPPGDFERSYPNIPPGTWSDDGAQALVLLDSLLQKPALDLRHLADGLVRWHDEGFMAVDTIVFDRGGQTIRAIDALKRGVEPELAGGTGERSNGNGSLMRVLPLALLHSGSDEALVRDAFRQSSVTHRHIRSQLCCAIYCLWARRILDGRHDPWNDAIESIFQMFPRGTPEHRELTEFIKPHDDSREIRGSGYVVDSLLAARWANTFGPYETVAKAAVSLGEDTDTTACIAGGIAGLRFGVHAIPRRWRDALRGREIYQDLVERLVKSVESSQL